MLALDCFTLLVQMRVSPRHLPLNGSGSRNREPLLDLVRSRDLQQSLRGDRFELIGTGVAAIYDNQLHGDKWYYQLKPGHRFDLATRKKID